MKNKLRKQLRKLERKREGTLLKSTADFAILDSLRGLNLLETARCVAGYIPLDGEVDLTPFLAELAVGGPRVCLPRGKYVEVGMPQLSDECAERRNPLDSRDRNVNVAYVMAEISSKALSRTANENFMVEGVFGIFEPNSTTKEVPNSEVDVWLVPALAFDERGVRLGRGGGFYDRFLVESAGMRIGIGYDSMILDKLPCDEWDQSMDLIVTERRLLWM